MWKGRGNSERGYYCTVAITLPEKYFVAKSSEDFEKNSPDGGCLLDCNFRLECGHACTLNCHFTDPEHVGYELSVHVSVHLMQSALLNYLTVHGLTLTLLLMLEF